MRLILRISRFNFRSLEKDAVFSNMSLCTSVSNTTCLANMMEYIRSLLGNSAQLYLKLNRSFTHTNNSFKKFDFLDDLCAFAEIHQQFPQLLAKRESKLQHIT